MRGESKEKKTLDLYLERCEDSHSTDRDARDKEVFRKLQFLESEEAHEVSENQIREGRISTPTKALGLYPPGLWFSNFLTQKPVLGQNLNLEP